MSRTSSKRRRYARAFLRKEARKAWLKYVHWYAARPGIPGFPGLSGLIPLAYPGSRRHETGTIGGLKR